MLPPRADTEATTGLGPGERRLTLGGAGDVTDGEGKTGDYTPGGSPADPAARPGSVPRVRTGRYALKRFHAKGARDR